MLDERHNEIIYFYSVQNKSMSWIARYYNCSSGVIKRILKKNNVTIRYNGYYLKKNVDEMFFEKIDTEEKAYILGFIYADGYITGKYFGIKVSTKDIEILEDIKRCLKSEHKIVTAINNNGYGKGNKYSCLIINNMKMVNDLMALGIKYNKSKILEFPTECQVPNDFMNHFIRGYFDGDGSVYRSKTGIGVSFVGTKCFLSGVLCEFNKFLDSKAQIYRYKNKDIYDLKIGGLNQIKKIYEYLYKDATIFLGRKKNKFEEII